MATLQCMKCQQDCVFKNRPKDNELFGAACDCCRNIFCRECALINTTEAHAVALTQRTLIFYCMDCKPLVKDIPKIKDLLKIIDNLKDESIKKDLRIEKLQNKRGDITKELQQKVDAMAIKIIQKDKHIAGLKSRIKDLENIANTEQEYVDKIEKQAGVITNTEKELIQLIDTNQSLTAKIQEQESKLSDLEKVIRELRELKGSMLTSIETLTAENQVHINDLDRARIDLATIQEELNKKFIQSAFPETEMGTQDRALESFTPKSTKHNNMNKEVSHEIIKILVLCDEQGRYIDNLLHKVLTNKTVKYKIESIIKPGASLCNVVGNLECLTREYTSKDYVILVAGSNDFKNNKIPSINLLLDKVKGCTHTNIVVLSVPYFFDYNINLKIHKFNIKLSDLLFKLNKISENGISCVDFNSEHGPRMGKKKMACREIVKIMRNGSGNKNIIFVKTQNFSNDCCSGQPLEPLESKMSNVNTVQVSPMREVSISDDSIGEVIEIVGQGDSDLGSSMGKTPFL